MRTCGNCAAMNSPASTSAPTAGYPGPFGVVVVAAPGLQLTRHDPRHSWLSAHHLAGLAVNAVGARPRSDGRSHCAPSPWGRIARCMTSGNTTPTPPGWQPPSTRWQRLQSRYSSHRESHAPPSSGHVDRLEDKGMTYYEAALQILRSSRQPLTAREITELAITDGLIGPTGKTPHASMKRVLYLRMRNDPELVKLEDPGSTGAKWGTVRWTLRSASAADPDLET
jgi:hypothetical protein